MPYGFSIWDGEERLVLWNRRYVEIYGLPADRLTQGMSLEKLCEVTLAAGNHAGTSAAGLLAEYRRRLGESANAATAVVFEKRIRGRAIKATYTNSPRSRLRRHA